MDELDRLFTLLVTALAHETRVAVPFPAADIYERLVPYRSNRSRLNVATHQDYEMAVLRLLAGERGYVRLEPDNVREAMRTEAHSVNPDPAYFRSFPDAQVMVNGQAAERVLLADRAYAPPPLAAPDAPGEEVDEIAPQHFVPPTAFQAARPTPPPGDGPTANQCEYCGGVLPAKRDAHFCPHCGQPQEGQLKCPGCGSDVDVGWAYCLTCGRATGFE